MLLEHKHLIVRAEIEHPPKNPEQINDWSCSLIQAIGMKVLMGPYSVYSDMPGNRGLTCVTVIETSHIALHVWDEVQPALMQLDVYSCAAFDPEQIFERVRRDFGAQRIEFKFLDREHSLTEILVPEAHAVTSPVLAGATPLPLNSLTL
jgi:S-adenosylmethionine/arginine decarboxylase-like enzyme